MGGVIVASSSSADIKQCTFVDNVGWALRFEGAVPVGSDVAPQSASIVTQSSVLGNVFSQEGSRGCVGQKRIRIDAMHDASVEVDGNQTCADGWEVEPLRKRRCSADAEEEGAALMMGELRMS